MDDITKNNLIWGAIAILGIFALFMFMQAYNEKPSSFWIYSFLLPILFLTYYFTIQTVKSQALLNAGGNISVFSYRDTQTYLQIIEDGSDYVWKGYVVDNSVTQYDWKGTHSLRVIASQSPDISDPNTVFFDLSYSVSGNNVILIVLNADGTYFEQLNVL